jgi:hypothetical protein
MIFICGLADRNASLSCHSNLTSEEARPIPFLQQSSSNSSGNSKKPKVYIQASVNSDKTKALVLDWEKWTKIPPGHLPSLQYTQVATRQKKLSKWCPTSSQCSLSFHNTLGEKSLLYGYNRRPMPKAEANKKAISGLSALMSGSGGINEIVTPSKTCTRRLD